MYQVFCDLPANCYTSLFCTEEVINKLVQLFCSHWKKARPTFCTDFTCQSMFVTFVLRNSQKERALQCSWACILMYFSWKHYSFVRRLCLFQKKGRLAVLWRKKKKETCQYLMLLKKRSSRAVFQWWSKKINEATSLFLAYASEDCLSSSCRHRVAWGACAY